MRWFSHKLISVALGALTMAVVIRSVQAAAITSGGPTQDFQVSGGTPAFSAADPVKAAVAWMAPATTAGTALDAARFSFGFTDGTRRRCISIRSRDAQTTTSTVRNAFATQMLSIFSASGTSALAQMDVSSLGTDKLTGTWGTLPPAAWLTNVMLFGGSDCQAYVGEFTCSASTDGTTVIDATSDPSFGFGFDVILLISRQTASAFNGTSALNAMISIGFATYDGSTFSNGCMSFSDENGLNTSINKTRLGGKVETGVCIRLHNTGAPTEGDACEITARTSVGFTATKRGAGGTAPVIAFLALKFNGALQGFGINANTTRTSPGSQGITTPGHCPQALLALFTQLTSANTLDTSTDAGSFGVGCATGASEEMCAAYMSTDNTSPSDTKCVTSAVFMDVPQPDGTAGVTADLTSFDATGETLNYTAVLAAARQHLILDFGRTALRASGKTVSGSFEKGAAKVPHAGIAKSDPGAIDKAKAGVPHAGRGRSTVGDVDKAIGSSAKGARGRALAGSNEKAVGLKQAFVRVRDTAGALLRAAPSLVIASGNTLLGKGVSLAGSISKARASLASGGRGRALSGSNDKAIAVNVHAARSRTLSDATGRVVGISAHAGRGRSIPGAVSRGASLVPHAGRGRLASGSSEKGTAGTAHGGRGRLLAGGFEKGQGKALHSTRSKTAAGALERAAPQKVSFGQVFAAGRSLAGSLEKAVAKVIHAARGRALAGIKDPTSPSVIHGARGRALAGSAERALGGIPRYTKARALVGAVVRAISSGKHRGRSQAIASDSSKAKASKRGAGRASSESMALARAQATVLHKARGRATSGSVSKAGLSSTAGLGFYEKTSRAVRSQFRSVAGALPVQHSNLEFAEPQGVAWARVWVNFDEIEEVQYGSGTATYIVPGELVVELRSPILEGTKTIADLADALAGSLELRQVSGIVYDAAEVGGERETGDDETKITLRVPFRAEDGGFAHPEGEGPAADDFAGAEASIRTRFAIRLPGVSVTFDNLPPSTGASWVRVETNETEAFNVDGVRRTVGVMIAEIHTVLLEGEKASLALADKITSAFRLVDSGGVKFSVPYLQGGRQVRGEWVLPVYCPWSCDHA